MAKRCVCGKSQRLPLCDGSHRSLGWVCEADSLARWAFVAGQHNENLAERLADELSGVAVHTIANRAGSVRASRVVLLVDATSLDEVRQLAVRVEARATRVVSIDLAPGLVAQLFPDAEEIDVRSATGDEPLTLWRSVLEAVTREGVAPCEAQRLSPSFVSHAVADEPVILPALEYLRRFAGADLFVCADSIQAGTRWHDVIVSELDRRPVLLWLLSKRSAASTFCAFEMGYATASKKRVVIVSLDGERPPAFAAHLHALDLERRRAVRPWLSRDQVLSDAILEALTFEAVATNG